MAAVVLLGGASASAGLLPPGEQARIFEKIRGRMTDLVGKYRGTFSRRRVVTREYDPDSGKLEATRESEQEVTEYFYRNPAIRILSCRVDGRPADPDDCRPRGKREAVHPIIDRNGPRHYQVEITGTARVQGEQCYKVAVVPRRRTTRHFSGHLYLRKSDLGLVLMEGMIASFPFGVKKFWMKMYFKELDGQRVVSRGWLDITVRVPVFFSMRIKSSFTARDHAMVKR